METLKNGNLEKSKYASNQSVSLCFRKIVIVPINVDMPPKFVLYLDKHKVENLAISQISHEENSHIYKECIDHFGNTNSSWILGDGRLFYISFIIPNDISYFFKLLFYAKPFSLNAAFNYWRPCAYANFFETSEKVYSSSNKLRGFTRVAACLQMTLSADEVNSLIDEMEILLSQKNENEMIKERGDLESLKFESNSLFNDQSPLQSKRICVVIQSLISLKKYIEKHNK
jgi:hypothetical protein